MKVIDLRSDTVTLPTNDMMTQMQSSPLGDDVYNEDYTTNELENLAARITGKESALLVSSGTMGNLISVLVHCERGTEVIVGDQSHTFLYENGGISSYGGIHSMQIKNDYDGTMNLELVKNAIRTNDIHFPITSLICIENTHNKCHGFPLALDYINSICDIAHNNNINLHMDGARLFNACTALKEDPKTILKQVDSVTFCLSKGLASPIGSIICGTELFIQKARRIRKSLGGGMRQTGIISSCGIVSLNTMIGRLEEDHKNAEYLANALSTIDGIHINTDYVKTNIIYFNYNHPNIDLSELILKMKSHGILFNTYNGNHSRLVLHHGVSKNDIENVIDVFNKLLS